MDGLMCGLRDGLRVGLVYGCVVVVPCVSANTRLCRVWLQVTEVERKTAYDNFYGKLTTDMLRAKVLC